MKMFEMLEELTKQLGEEHPQVKQNWDTFFKLASPYLKFDGTPSLKSLKFDTRTIRERLHISAPPSIDYSFINSDFTRNQLQVDNLRMENAKLDITEKNETVRFYGFCTHAFCQVEDMLNYYYHLKFPKIKDLVKHISGIHGIKFTPTGSEQNVSDITTSTKIFAFGKTHFNTTGDYTGATLNSIRLVRNEGAHRCSVIVNATGESQLKKFLNYKSYDNVRSAVKKVAAKIQEELSKK